MISETTWNGYYNAYFFGEAKGAELIWGLLDFAPGEAEREWVKVWAQEEEFHHKLWADLVRRKGIQVTQLKGPLSGLYEITGAFVNNRDWTGSMVGAAVIEHISTSAATFLYKYADDDTRVVFRKIVGDDLGHLDFDLQQLEKAAETSGGRKRLLEVHKKFLQNVLEWPFRSDLLEGELEILNDAYETHCYKLAKFGVFLPSIKFENSLAFKLKKRLLELLA